MGVKIQLSGSGLNFDGEVSLFQATQIMAFIARPPEQESNESPLELLSSEAKTEAPKSNVRRYESPRDAIDSLQAKTNPQKIVALSLYLGATSANGVIIEYSQVLAEFTNAGEKTPKNISRDVNDAVSAGYLYPTSKTSFRLLLSADTVPEQGFKTVKRRRSAPKNRDKASAPKLEIRAEVLNMPIVTSLDGYMDYFDLKLRSDQIVWILKYAEGHKIAGLNRLEIINVSSRIGGDIDSKAFTASNKANVKNGYVSLTGSQFALTAKGNKYASEELVSA